MFKVTSGLKLSRDFTERYLFKISADGYHVGWCSDAGADYDFYNTKHEILYSVDKSEMPQLSDPKVFALECSHRCSDAGGVFAAAGFWGDVICHFGGNQEGLQDQGRAAFCLGHLQGFFRFLQ